jgi:superoxide dismutase, Fe-Mn family
MKTNSSRRELFLALAGAGAGLSVLRAQTQAPIVTLPRLPYALDALEPYIDAKTMEIHHGKHHQAYVDGLNRALGSLSAAQAKRPVEELLCDVKTLPEAVQTAVRNHGGGHLNHSLFWQSLGKGGSAQAPKGKLAKAIEVGFGSSDAFLEKIRASGASVFGSGWVWVTPEAGGQVLRIETSPNQDGPWLNGRKPLFGIDVWEHAYYLKYQNRRPEYLSAVVQVLNWDFLSARYEEIAG